MLTMAGAAPAVICSLCGTKIFFGDVFSDTLTYQEKFAVANIPNLLNNKKGSYINEGENVFLASYKGEPICFNCLKAKVAEYKDVNNLSSPGTGNTPITVTAEASTFNVTVPTSIPLVVKADGTVTAPTDVKLVNGSAGSVQVSSIAMNNVDWTLTDYNSGNRSKLAEAKVDSKKLGLSLAVAGNAAVTNKDGSQTPAIDTSRWSMPGSSELPITVGAIATASSSKTTSEVTAANVIFTLAWK